MSSPSATQHTVLSTMRGGKAMAADINASIACLMDFPTTSNTIRGWFELASNNRAARRVVAINSEGTWFHFAVDEEGQMRANERTIPDLDCPDLLKKIRVVALIKGKWHLDPSPENQAEKIWIFGNRPVARLQWDPGEFPWKRPRTQSESGEIEFFRYSVKLGRTLLSADEVYITVSEKRWDSYGIHKELRTPLWKGIWNNPLTRMIISFRWLLIHRGLAVGARAKGMNIVAMVRFAER